MAYKYEFGGAFEPPTLALTLEARTLPAIAGMRPMLAGTDDFGTDEGLRSPSPDELLKAVERFAPPEDLPGAGEIYAALMVMVALRANTASFSSSYPNPSERYEMAARWICENFGELIFWDCD